jgi:hypothetical protein
VLPGCAVRFADCDIHHLWWWSLAGPTDLDLQIPVCPSHHRWLHEGGYTITLEDDLLVFRDPRGRVIGNRQHILAEQLDLLHQTQAHVPDQPTEADDIVHDLTAWTTTPYRSGRWGWTGANPGPPTGHAPPQPA